MRPSPTRPPKAPERLLWAISALELAPSDHVLEIGCGTGVAAALVCDALRRGKLLAIDRSATAIAAARKLNRDHVKSGRAEFVTGSLQTAKLEGRRFHKIFAFNVGSLRKEGSSELARAAKLLRPNGRLWLFERPPSAAKTASVAEGWLRALQANGFAVHDVVFHELSPAPVVSVVAALPRD